MNSRSFRIALRLFLLFSLVVGSAIFLWNFLKTEKVQALTQSPVVEEIQGAVKTLNNSLSSKWKLKGLSPTPAATNETLARRLSLALTGAVPSLEELRKLENAKEGTDTVNAWLDHLFADKRYADYLAERLARVYVGVEPGPFLVYRRRRMVNWLSEEIGKNQAYDQIVQDMMGSHGIWTTNPEANFITVATRQNMEKKGLDEVKLATRASRAFLGISMDCMQCHDDKFGDHWKQKDFHQLAAFFSKSEIALTGVQENEKRIYETRLRGNPEEEEVGPKVPYRPDLLPENGDLRSRLSAWITHRENEAFSRAMVNRAWALIFGRPLVEPVDDIPLEGPYPAGMEILARDFADNNYDLQRLFRVIASSEAFRRSSSSGDAESPVTGKMEFAWAAFPVTPLRSEQVAGSIIQASNLHTIDSESHIIKKFQRMSETNDFVKRFGDQGEDEVREESGTIPQRLLLMNGKLVGERIKPNPFFNASSRVADYSTSDDEAVENAFLTVLTRRPSEPEKAHFTGILNETYKKNRQNMMADIYWALINSTEFSWNR